MSVANLSNQIRLMNRLVKRDLSTDPVVNDWLILQLATMLDAAGTQSILDLVYYSNQAANLSFFFDQKTAHVYDPQTQGITVTNFTQGMNGGNLFTILGSSDRENDKIFLFFTKDGFPVFWNISQDVGSTWADARAGLVFVASVVLSVVGVPIATELGGAILGADLAAAYPALAQGIGQACISTLMNGGDIEKGVTGAVASYVGAGVGGEAASVTGSDIIGQASAAATRAFINGGNPSAAVAQSLLQNGVSNVQTLLLSGAGDDSLDPVTYDPFNDGSGAVDTSIGFDPNAGMPGNIGVPTMSGSYYTDENGITYGTDVNGDLAVVDFVDDAGIGYATDAQGDLAVLEPPTTADITQATAGTDNNGTVPYGSSGASTNSLAVLTTLATAALPLIKSYVQAGMPGVRAGSASSTVNANGTITTRNANGTTTVTKPAAGTPYVTTNGTVITNNGDGTFTTVSPSGAIKTQSYQAAASGMNSQALMIGLGALAVLALAR